MAESNSSNQNSSYPNLQSMSYYEPAMEGDWKNRKISLFGVVRSFVSQLRPGQDLTRVSVPAVMLYPYSILEVFGCRELTSIDYILGINNEEDPLQRMLIVLKWLLSTIQQETFYKKPYNPVIGENHECWIDSPEYGRSNFIAEQVSHHPPISAIYITNTQQGITFLANLSFGVKFGGNYLSVITEGNCNITVDKFNEEYEIPKRTPDMIVKNVVFGTKRIFWAGEITVGCAKTGYSANLTFKESGTDNVIKGNIVFVDPHSNIEHELFNLEGKCGGQIFITPCPAYFSLFTTSWDPNEKKLLADLSNIVRPNIQYKPKKDLMADPYASMVVWSDVNKHIVDNDMEKADETKKRIEQDQRDRIKKEKSQGIDHVGKYFQKTESAWLPKKDIIFSQPTYKGNIFFKESSSKSPSQSPTFSSQPPSISNATSITNNNNTTNATTTTTTTSTSTSSVTNGNPSTVATSSVSTSNATNGTITPKKKMKKKSSTMESSSSVESDKDDKDTVLASNTLSASVEVPTAPEKEPVATSKPKISTTHSSSSAITSSTGLATPSSSNAMDVKQKKRLSTAKDSVTPLSLVNSGTFEINSNSNFNLKENGAASSPSNAVGDGFPKHLTDETNILTGWMKMRNSMKLWINRWVVLRPGRLIYYKDDKDMLRDRCAGILRLADCEVKERPTNKDGFSFKIYHLLHYPIYHKYGLKGETLKLAMLPVSWNYCIFRVTSEQERRSWMEAISAQIEYANSVESRNHHPKDRAIESFDSPSDFEDEEHPSHMNITPISEPVVPPVEELESVNPSEVDIFQKNLIEGISIHQKNTSKSIQKRTLKVMEEWKKELDLKMINMERRLLVAIKQQNNGASGAGHSGANSQNKFLKFGGSSISFSFPIFFLFVFVCILIGRFSPM